MERDFKGVWIPKEIWLDASLSIAEKCLLVEIDSLDNDPGKGCFASNEYLSKFIGLSEGRTANMISNLRKRGYIENVFFDGRNRGLRVAPCESSLHENVKPDFTKTLKLTSRKREHSNTVRNTVDIDNTLEEKKEPLRIVFEPPKEEQVRAIFEREFKGALVRHFLEWSDWETKKFFDFYQSKGWKVGVKQTQMKNWKTSVMNWASKAIEDGIDKKTLPAKYQVNQRTQSNGKYNNRNSETPDDRNLRVAAGAIELHEELLRKHGIKPGDYSGGH